MNELDVSQIITKIIFRVRDMTLYNKLILKKKKIQEFDFAA